MGPSDSHLLRRLLEEAVGPVVHRTGWDVQDYGAINILSSDGKVTLERYPSVFIYVGPGYETTTALCSWGRSLWEAPREQ